MDHPYLSRFFGLTFRLPRVDGSGARVQLSLGPDALVRTVEEFNAACDDRSGTPERMTGRQRSD